MHVRLLEMDDWRSYLAMIDEDAVSVSRAAEQGFRVRRHSSPMLGVAVTLRAACFVTPHPGWENRLC